MQEFQNNTILNHDLPDFEQTEFTPISRKYLKVVLLNWGIFSVFLLIASGVGCYFLQDIWGKKAGFIFLPSAILILFVLLQNYFAFFQRKYAIREHDVMYHHGWLKREIMMIPYNRIQHVELNEGWYSRQLGLKSLAVFTASSEDLTIRGLPKQVAENFNQLILKKIVEEELEEEKIDQKLTALEDAAPEKKESDEG